MSLIDLARLSRSPLARDLIYLYLERLATSLLPLITLPYLARVLEPHAFGALAVAQALGMYVQFLLEFGYSLTGTREIAQRRGDVKLLSEILWGVLGARLLLAFPAAAIVALAHQFLGPLRQDPGLALGAYFYAVANAFNPSWFYRGLGRMREASALEVFARVVALGGILLWVRSPEEARLVLFINGGANALVNLLALRYLSREFGFVLPRWATMWSFLRIGFGLFPFHAVNALNLVVNPFLLSLFAPSAAVGVFAAAERLARSFWAMLDPLSRALFPRFAHLAAQNPLQASVFAFRALIFQGLLGGIVTAIVFLTAPGLVRLLLGAGYEEATPLLRIMAFMLLGGALANVLGVQWALAIKQDGLVSRVAVFAILLQVVLASYLAPRYGAVGVAWGLVVTSFVEVAGLAFGLLVLGQFPGARPRFQGSMQSPESFGEKVPMDRESTK